MASGTSLRTAPSRLPRRAGRWCRSGSIVAQLTAWYAVSAFLLILSSTAFLYWALASNFDAEDRRTLATTADELRFVLRASSPEPSDAATGEAPSLRQPREIWVRVLAGDGRALLETSGMAAELPIAVLPVPEALLPGQDMSTEIRSVSGKLFQTFTTRLSADPVDDRVLQVAMDRGSEELLLARYRERLLAVLSASLLVCSAAGYAIARRGLGSIRRITSAAQSVRSSTLHERIDVAHLPAELRALAETFNEMLDRLEASFAQISQFSADVAHELRTPVNNLRGEIEVTLGRDRTAGEYRDVLGSALEECVRISRVIQSLLFLARAETAPDSLHPETIQVRREIEAVLEFYEASGAEAGVTLAVEGGHGLSAPFDRTLFQQAIGNLVANAIAHTPRGGSVVVRPCSTGGRLRVEVADTGRGIADDDLPHVFDRFYRANRARSGSADNLGLGLAVVRSIVTLHGGQVAIESGTRVGTRVTLETPLQLPSPLRAEVSRPAPATE